MLDRNGKPVVPGSVVFEVGAFLSPGIVLADGVSVVFLASGDNEAGILKLVAEIAPYDVMVVEPSEVDWASYSN